MSYFLVIGSCFAKELKGKKRWETLSTHIFNLGLSGLCKKIWLRISFKFLIDKGVIKQWNSPYVNSLQRPKWLNESSKIYHRNITLNVRGKALIGADSKRASVKLTLRSPHSFARYSAVWVALLVLSWKKKSLAPVLWCSHLPRKHWWRFEN